MDGKMSIPLDKLPLVLTPFKEGEDIQVKLNLESDLESVRCLLLYHNHCLELGSRKRTNFKLDWTLKQLNTEGKLGTVEIILDIINLGLKAQLDEEFLREILENLRHLKDKNIQLKLFDALLIESNKAVLIESGFNEKYIIELLKISEPKFLFYSVIPKYINLFNKSPIFEEIWKEAETSKNLKHIAFLSKHYFENKTFDLLALTNYWDLLLECLNSEIDYKTAVYLLKLSLDESGRNECESGYLTTLLYASAEKQHHLVQPALPLLADIKNLDPKWLNLIYTKLLRHPHNGVAFRTLNFLLETKPYLANFFNLLIKEALTVLNRTEIIFSQDAFKNFTDYILTLSEEEFNILLDESLSIHWAPVGFYKFYKTILKCSINFKYLLEFIKLSKTLPHKYIREDCLRLTYEYIKLKLAKEKLEMYNLIDIILELNEFGLRLTQNDNLLINQKLINKMIDWLNQGNLQKIDFIIQLVYRRDVEVNFIKEHIFKPFMEKKYPYQVLDRLTHLYNLRLNHLQNYLLHRLDVNEVVTEICYNDKCNYELIQKCIRKVRSAARRNENDINEGRRTKHKNEIKIINNETAEMENVKTHERVEEVNECPEDANRKNKNIANVESSGSNENITHLAFEILFYSNDSNFIDVYKDWIAKILLETVIIHPKVALSFVKLLSKIPVRFLKQINFEDILNVYEQFFSTQGDEVTMRIFQNLDLVFEFSTHSNFISTCLRKLMELRRCECYDKLVRSFVRNVALTYNKMKTDILNFTMRSLYELGKKSDIIIYYTSLYFKTFELKSCVFPFYEFIFFGDVLTKAGRCEYDVCKEIYLESNKPNPCFRTEEIHKWALENILSKPTENTIDHITSELLTRYKRNFNKRYFPNSMLHLEKLRIMQTISFMLPHMSETMKNELTTLLVSSFSTESHQASVRQLMQFILLKLCLENRDRFNNTLEIIDSADKLHTSTITGLIPVLYGLELLTNDVDFSQTLVTIMLPWTMGPNFKLRLYSQLSLYLICEKNSKHRKFKTKFETLHKSLVTVVKSTDEIDDSIKNDLELIDYIHKYNCYENNKTKIHLISIYIPERTGVISTEWEYFKIKNDWRNYMKRQSEAIREVLFTEHDVEMAKNIQRKMVPWKESLNDTIKNELIVITTLIDSAANLGGLSRTCEIFGVKRMVVNNSKVLQEKEFQCLSMTSEWWLDVTEVKLKDLPEYLLKLKGLGYCIIGAEQTSDSCLLDAYSFEAKSVLLLGNERSGISQNLIPLMDVCVEIPQFGKVRSLNVHVAGAMFIWEYAKQYDCKTFQ